MRAIDCLMIGAGVAGLACASLLARTASLVLLVEAEYWIGSRTTNRNSGVSHAGLYYSLGSLNERHCVEGGDLFSRWCIDHHVEHLRIGKFLVSVNRSEIAVLEGLQKDEVLLGVESLQVIFAKQLIQIHPVVSGVAVLLSPDTGIIDSHGYLQTLLADVQSHGTDLAVDIRISRSKHDGQYFQVEGLSCGENFSVAVQRVSNATGLFSSQLATCITDA